MNQAPNNQQPGNFNTFTSQPGSQTNPFTADLKGEFTSNFGTNTNAVSQIFKEGGFAGSNRAKVYIALAVVLLLAAGAAFYLMEIEVPLDETPIVDATKVEPPKVETPESATPAEQATVDKATTEVAEETTKAEETAPAKTGEAGAISLVAPQNGATVGYDETQGPAEFTWQGNGSGAIIFSRNAEMKPEVMRVQVTGNKFAFNHPWPGTWYWRVENEAGASEIRSFNVTPPARRNVVLSAPTAGATIAGSGGEVAWQGDNGVAFYRVELSTGDWANPQYRFATSGAKLQLNGVSAGKYQMRLGAFSEVAGRWEYTAPVEVNVQ